MIPFKMARGLFFFVETDQLILKFTCGIAKHMHWPNGFWKEE